MTPASRIPRACPWLSLSTSFTLVLVANLLFILLLMLGNQSPQCSCHRTTSKQANPLAISLNPDFRVRLFLQGSLQFPDTALEILNFPERANIPRPWERLLLGNGPHHITLRFWRSPMSRMLEKLHPVHRVLHRLWLTFKGVHPRILAL